MFKEIKKAFSDTVNATGDFLKVTASAASKTAGVVGDDILVKNHTITLPVDQQKQFDPLTDLHETAHAAAQRSMTAEDFARQSGSKEALKFLLDHMHKEDVEASCAVATDTKVGLPKFRGGQ